MGGGEPRYQVQDSCVETARAEDRRERQHCPRPRSRTT
jgi:hypothetical protein